MKIWSAKPTWRLDHHPLEVQFALALFLCQIGQGGAQVVTDGAADAAVAHLDDVFLRVCHQDLVVDVFFAELVLDHGDLLAVGFREHALEQRGLARAEKAGEDGGGDERHGRFRMQKAGRECSAAM